MATTNPNIIGVATECIICGWFFRRPMAQSWRVICRACE